MTTMSLSEAPARLPEHAKETWLHGATPEVNVGDLWILAWDLAALTMVVVTEKQPGYILGCPVTLPDAPKFAPALIVDETPLGVPLTIWAFAETGIGAHLLARNLGPLMSARTAELVRAYAAGGAEPPLPVAAGDYMDEENAQFAETLVRDMQRACYHEWPIAVPGQAILNREQVKRLKARQIADVIHTPMPRVAALLKGEECPTEDETEALCRELEIDREALLVAPNDTPITLLMEPRYKEPLHAVMAVHHCTEVEARNKARSEYTLAARTNLRKAHDRMDAAFQRLLAGTPDGSS